MLDTASKFDLGQVIVTKEARIALEQSGQDSREFLERHQNGDWGNLTAAESRENDRALLRPSFVRSVYKTSLGVKLWVLTTSDRSTTTILVAP
jgi:hypothetical protein